MYSKLNTYPARLYSEINTVTRTERWWNLGVGKPRAPGWGCKELYCRRTASKPQLCFLPAAI